MSSVEPIRVAVSLRVDRAPNYEERRDSLAQDWADHLGQLDVMPFLVPNTLRSCRPLLESWGVQAVLLTGGNDPPAPGVPPSMNGAPERDRTERELIRFARTRNLPVIGVCRGAQMLNLYFGGGLGAVEDSDLHVATTHPVRLSTWVGKPQACVNSFHALSIRPDRLGRELSSFAWAEDGTVEGFHHRQEPILGIMWHPERPGPHEPALADLLPRALRGERPWLDSLAEATPA